MMMEERQPIWISKECLTELKKAKKEKWNGDWDKRINEAELKIKNDLLCVRDCRDCESVWQ